MGKGGQPQCRTARTGKDGHVSKEDQGLLYQKQQQENKELRVNSLEGECEYSLLFESPGESDWVKISEPYVPKFSSEEGIRKREEWRK
ncbi:hypothetical protein ABZP36_028510 [Zizania latifolia]